MCKAAVLDVYDGKEGDTFELGWRNKLIWGDNLLVMASLLEKFAVDRPLLHRSRRSRRQEPTSRRQLKSENQARR